jgi:hypothetical protein
MRGFAIISAALILAGALSACSKTYTWRYKLTLEVATPEGIKSAFNVVEMSEYLVSFPHGGVRGATTGEAVYLDLGPGRYPLVTLLTVRVGSSVGPYGQNILEKVYGGKYEWNGDRNDGLAALIRNRGAREITIDQLPELVTFTDPLDPKTVAAVDAKNIGRVLGDGISWHRMTIEITDEPVTTGLEKKLPWVNQMRETMLDGQRTSQHVTLSNSLSTADFKRGGF